MAQYKTGSVSVTNGSAVVTGTGTLWVGEVAVGDIFTIVGSNAWYEVGAVNSNTSITLTANYAGATITDSTYAISRDFTANYGLPYPQKGDIETASLIKRAFQDIDSKLVLTSSSGDVTITGDLIVAGSTISLDNATVQTFTWGDNDKAIFGDGSDLQIYHDGTNSIINENGTGDLQLQVAGSTKLTTTSTGIDVTGTVVSDGLTVDSGSATNNVEIVSGVPSTTTGTSTLTLRPYNSGTGTTYSRAEIIGESTGAGDTDLVFKTTTTSTGSVQRMRIDDLGDISFYEDTGTTAKFFWDASTESLGIGTTPTTKLHVYDADPVFLVQDSETSLASSNARLRLAESTTGGALGSYYDLRLNGGNFTVDYDGTERLRIDSAGNVGIGTTSPQASAKLHVYAAGDYTDESAPFTVGSSTTGDMRLYAGVNNTSDYTYIGSVRSGQAYGSLVLQPNGGNLGLGVTPSGWDSSQKAFDFGYTGSLKSSSSGNSVVSLSNNAYYSTTGWKYKQSLAASLYEMRSDGEQRWNIAPSGTAGGTITFTQAMTLDASGRLGIGTTSPATNLDVSTSSGNTFIRSITTSTTGTALIQAAGDSTQTVVLRTWGTANAGALFGQTLGGWSGLYSDGAASNGLIVGTFTSKPLLFGTANTERARITSAGDLLVVKTSTGFENVGAEFRADGLSAFSRSSSSATLYVAKPDTANPTGDLVGFRYNATVVVGTISYTSSSVAYNTSSDYRLKEDWQPMTGASERVKALKPVNFAWKSDGSRVDGFLAHEAQAVVPEAVTGEKDAVELVDIKDEDGNVTGQEERPVYQGIDQSKLVPLLTAALQEALAKIESLEARLDAANL